MVSKRVCLGLQRRDRDRLLHGEESGVIKRLPHGEFIEVHTPVDPDKIPVLTASRVSDHQPVDPGPEVDENGVKRSKGRLSAKLGTKLSSFYFADRIPPVTPEELAEAAAHHDHAIPRAHRRHGRGGRAPPRGPPALTRPPQDAEAVLPGQASALPCSQVLHGRFQSV